MRPSDLVTRLIAVATVVAIGCGRDIIGATARLGSLSEGARQIVVLGDSLAVSPSPAQSFPAWLQQRLNAQLSGWTIVNAGIRGDTTSGGRGRVTPLLHADVRVLIVALGANDGLRGVPLRTIEDNLSAIAEAAQQRGIRVLLCGMETPPIRSWEYTFDFHHLFPRVAQRYDIPLVPFLLTGVALVQEMNLEDGVHPNAAGARVIADNVWPYLEPMVRQLAGA